jgi:hypothetical protein
MEILARVMASGASTSPLKNDREIGVRSGDRDDVTNAVDGTWFECDMLDTSLFQRIDNLCSLLGGWNTSRDAESFNG